MNQEIKFRAWDKEKQKMIFFDNPFHAMIISSKIASAQCGYDIDIMQYTGLKDKNGLEGYHKDLWFYLGVVYTIEWDEDEAKFYLKHPDSNATNDDSISAKYLELGEIIGNTYTE